MAEVALQKISDIGAASLDLEQSLLLRIRKKEEQLHLVSTKKEKERIRKELAELIDAYWKV